MKFSNEILGNFFSLKNYLGSKLHEPSLMRNSNAGTCFATPPEERLLSHLGFLVSLFASSSSVSRNAIFPLLRKMTTRRTNSSFDPDITFNYCQFLDFTPGHKWVLFPASSSFPHLFNSGTSQNNTRWHSEETLPVPFLPGGDTLHSCSPCSSLVSTQTREYMVSAIFSPTLFSGKVGWCTHLLPIFSAALFLILKGEVSLPSCPTIP